MPRVPQFFIRCILSVISSLLFAEGDSYAQEKIDHKLIYHFTGKDSLFDPLQLNLQQSFDSETKLEAYFKQIPQALAAKGYPIASVDSFWTDTTGRHLLIYPGPKFNLVALGTAGIEDAALSYAGFLEKSVLNKPVNLNQLSQLQSRILDYYERNGYPFASIYLDSISIINQQMSAALRVDKSVLYHIDSIRVIGNASIKNRFLQRYLGITKGSMYNKDRLNAVDKRIGQLSYFTAIQPSDLTMLGSGSVLNLYLQTRRSSQVNFLVGFLPSSGDKKKLQLTADVNLDLKNMFGGGEAILVKWQQLQPKSPRLNLGFNQPYIFNSAFGFDVLFDLFKKDSSFLQINAQIGGQYSFSAEQTGKLFFQYQTTSLLSGAVDTNQIKIEKRLPANIDVSSMNIGLNYEMSKTNYRLNPRSGNELSFTSSIGIKKVAQNTEITAIKDPAFNYASLYDSVKPESYQMRLKFTGAHYFPLGKFTVLRAGLTAGGYLSPDIFRNELFQLGGFKLLRGFDEESIYASRFAVLSLEYRILVDMNSYFFFFTDGAIVKNKFQSVDVSNNFISTGLGLMYETKFGLLNMSFALGKRNDTKFSLREASKIHFGYINYF